MRLTALFVIFVLLTGVMMMSISYDAFAGKGEKRVNITVKDITGMAFFETPCVVLNPSDLETISIFKETNKAGKVGLFFSDSFDAINVKCNGTVFPVVGTFDTTKHTINIHITL